MPRCWLSGLVTGVVSLTAQIILAVMGMGILILAAAQAVEYLGGRSLISAKHFALRMLMAALLLICVAAIYVGAIVRWASRWHELGYWLGVLTGTIIITMLAMLDLRWCERLKHQRRAELYRSLAEAERVLRGEKEKQP
ncbi:MAG: hypothetical protein N2512_06485 [Armatimonadetes bacterium]|nr:hypothetical protein [Armatimonadota bacterium]